STLAGRRARPGEARPGEEGLRGGPPRARGRPRRRRPRSGAARPPRDPGADAWGRGRRLLLVRAGPRPPPRPPAGAAGDRPRRPAPGPGGPGGDALLLLHGRAEGLRVPDGVGAGLSHR